MKLNPQQAPVYGKCVLTVQLDDEDQTEEEEVDFFLLFSGSSQRHLSSTLRVGHVTLQAVCPAHDVCEQVLVTLCTARPGGPVDTHSQETFCFIQDLALDMAHFLLDNSAPQEALLFDDEQIPLEECERLDQNLALALQHHLTHHRAGPAQVTVTDAHGDTEVSTPLDSRTVASGCQQLSRLLHLAAGHGLRTVAAFLLQQPGGREALSRPDAQGLTAARLAHSRGHRQLAELFTLYETSLNVQAEEPHVHWDGRLFQHHPNLGTYSLTFPRLRRTEGGAETHMVRGEVEELTRRIHLHREEKAKSACVAARSPARDPAAPACPNGPSVVTTGTCGTTIEEQGRPRSLEGRGQGRDPAAVTHASATSGPLCQRQETGGEQKGTPAASSPAARGRKNRKRTTKSARLAAESPGSNSGAPEAGGGSAQRPAENTGSSAETDETASPIGDTETHNRAEETPLPTKPAATPGADGRKAAVLPADAIIEKQEGEKWEVELLTCERVAETEAVTKTERRHTKSFPAEDAGRTGAMGQEQSQDQQDGQLDRDEPGQVDAMDPSGRPAWSNGAESPDAERKPRRVLWRDGRRLGGRTGPSPHGPDASVWYHGEKPDGDEDWDGEEANSRSVWYDGGAVEQRQQPEQVMKGQEECALSSAQASALSSPQLAEQPLSSHRLSSALSQPHAAGRQPAPSHGPGAQRREGHGSQGEEEVGPDWKQGGAERGREEASGRDTTHSTKGSETADIGEAVEGDGHGGGDKGAKGRKRRRKKRGRKGAEGKLSSSSSIESQSHVEVKGSDLNAGPEATDARGEVDVETPTSDAMRLPGQTRDVTNPDLSGSTREFSSTGCGRTDGVTASQSLETKELSEDTDSIVTASDLQVDTRKADVEAIISVHSVEKEILCPTEVDQPAADSKVSFVYKDQMVADHSLEPNRPEGLSINLSHLTELTEASSLAESPEQKTQQEQSKKPAHPTGSPCPAGAWGLQAEATADVLPLETRESTAETTARGLLEHCLSPPTPRDQQHEEGKRNEPLLGGESDCEVCSLIDPEQEHNEGMVATAVAIVAVAIASAVASIELSQQLADNQPERHEPINQMPHNSLVAVQPAQLIDKENCQPLPDGKDNPPTGHFASKEPANVEISVESEKPPAAQLKSNRPVTVDLLAIAETLQKEEMRTETETTQNQIGRYPQQEEDDSLTRVNAESNETILTTRTQVESQRRLGGPVVDPCQHPEASGTCCTRPGEHKGPQGPSMCKEESGVHHRPHGDDGPPLASVTAGGEGETPDSPHSLEDPHGQMETPRGGEIHTVAPCDATLWDNLGPEGPAAPLKAVTGLHQPVRDAQLIPARPPGADSSTLHLPDDEGLEKDFLDTVDGWKEREKKKRDEEERKELVPGDVPAQTAAEEERQQDAAPNLQIQRERDVLCPEADTEPPCTDARPRGGECVPLRLLHGDKDTKQERNDEPNDGVFKKPRDPPPFNGHRARGVRVSWTSTKDASTRGVLAPPEGAVLVGAPAAGTPRSSRLSWKSETEDRGGGRGGETDAGGAEGEEKKDQLPENAVPSGPLRAPPRSSSPFRRHSWEPTGNNADIVVSPRSLLQSPSGEQRAKPPLHRRSMSWCPSNWRRPDQEPIDSRSYSLEGLEVEKLEVRAQCPSLGDQEERTLLRSSRLDGQERGSLLSLTEEEQEGEQVPSVTNRRPAMFHQQTLTKSISMVAIGPRDIDGISTFSNNSGSLEYSISEEEPGPLRSDAEAKGGPKISRTFSYIRNKMTKKSKEKERKGERERESKEREKKSASGHVFIPAGASPSAACQHCSKVLNSKETFLCNNCGAHVHKCCRESLPTCTKSKAKQQLLVAEAAPGSAVNTRSKSTSSASSASSTSSSSSRERWSTATSPEEQLPLSFPRRHPGLFNPHSNLAKSISTSNIAGLDEVSLKGLKFLSQSTDSLHKGGKVNASTESLTDEGTEMMDSQLMGEFECDTKDLEADSWSGTMEKKFLKLLKKDEIKKQDVIYELYQTEFHHVRTLKIMSEVYYKGLQKELQLDPQTLDKIFPVLDDMLETHTHFLTLLLERKKASSTEGQNNNYLIFSIGDVLLNQFSGSSADRMKRVYGKFCSRHSEAVNLYKDLHAKDKRFQAFIKRTMSSSIVRRLSIPECILLVTQRITKYPVLIQRMLQHTKDSDEDHGCVCEALRCVKEMITAVDSKVNEQEKKQKLREVYSRTDSKSIMRMKSGQMFAKEDLIRGRKLLHDGALQLKNSAGRLKDVQAMLLSDVLIFLQEKDQKYVFASLDQRSTVISLQSLIVREVANEERGLFLITAGIEKPEMVEVLASSKEERNTWRAIIQDAMHCMEKDEDEGVPSETEEDRRQQESRAKEIRELLRRKDEQIISLLEEKVHIFRDLGDSSPAPDDPSPPVRERMLFMATPDDVTKGEPIMMDALREVETLHGLVNSGCSVPVGLTGGSVGPVCLPRRAETFGGFDSHQMNSSKNGDKEEGDESLDLRRTESDSVLKKGATASLQMLLKRNHEQVQHSVTHLHGLLISLQAVVVQQDSYIEDQRQTLSERLTANSSRHSSSSSLSSSSSSRPSSLIEQEKHRSLERQRQEAATLQKQQAAHQEEKRRREKAWELKDRCLAEREERLRADEDQTQMRHREVTEEWEALRRRKEEYQVELERLREAQRRLDRDKEALKRDTERLEAMKKDESEQLHRYQRTPSTTSEESIRFHSSGSLDLEPKEAAEQPKVVELSTSAPTKEPFLRIGSKRMKKNFNPFSSSSSSKTQGAEKEAQLPNRLLQLTKPKEKKDKRKTKGKAEQTQTAGVMLDPQNDGDIFFC
ncbi:uncharacterized protein LOC120808992 isoform X6 [Gasterosteus aculeatus]